MSHQRWKLHLEYACARSKKTSRKIIIATFIEPLDVLTTQGVTEIMKNEARDEAEKLLQRAASQVQDKTGEMPALAVREGETIFELKKLIEITNISLTAKPAFLIASTKITLLPPSVAKSSINIDT